MPAPYGQSLALVTDLYQLTMAYGYWKEGIAEREAVFHQFFRQAPFSGSFAVAAGLATAVEWLRELRFDAEDCDYLATLTGADGRPLFDADFLSYLSKVEFRCDVDAIAEGTTVFPQEPLVRVRGPLLQAQLIETALLNIINFQTLIATKAARVCVAAGDDPVLEFGLRRAQGFDGGLSASRAAYIGGCAATSNVLAGKLYGIPVRGTHAHSWVLSFDNELESFEAYARAIPNNCVFLVDTYDSIAGVKRAIAVGKKLREDGHQLVGIRLDSGDLSALSQDAARLLEEAGLGDVFISASNDLDEHRIADLKAAGARINVWGVGTRLVSGWPDAALGGVYKLSALRDGAGQWQLKAKRSEQSSKASTPGMLQVRRYSDRESIAFDLLYDELHPPTDRCVGIDPQACDPDRAVRSDMPYENLLKPVLSQGEVIDPPASLEQPRSLLRSQLTNLPSRLLTLDSQERLPVLMERSLFERCERFANDAVGETCDPI